MSLIFRCPVNAEFKQRHNKLFCEQVESDSCYGNYRELKFFLHKYCKATDRILTTGCQPTSDGKSLFIEDLYDAGFHSVVGVDSSEKIISTSKERNKENRPEIQFITAKGFKIDAEADGFNVLIDRGELDMIHEKQSSFELFDFAQHFEAAQRLLKVGGRYICFSFATTDVLDQLLVYFSSGWFFRVHMLNTELSDGKLLPLPFFCFILTKTKSAGLSSQPLQIIEVCLDGTESIQRLNCFSEVRTNLQEIQQYFITRKSLEKLRPQQHLTIDLYLSSGGHKQRSEPRYSLTTVDIQPSLAKNGKFAIFIVPQGRETEWLFSSKDGQTKLSTNAGFERVVIVTLGRGHAFTDMDAIKGELSTKVMELVPRRLSRNAQVPFLSIGEDLGNRVVLYEGNSQLSGDYVVEDVDGDGGQKFRRLIFLNNKNVVQSEARLVTDKTNVKKGKGKQRAKVVNNSSPRVDHGYLACQHHRVIVTGLAWIEGFCTTGENKKSLIVGLGGGGLAMFLYQYFKQLSIEVVELDPSISEIAKSWFEFKEDDRMQVIIEDGLKYIRSKESAPRYDVIIFDVDSKDTSVGMSCPPQAFVDRAFLRQVHSLLSPSGVFVLNLVCRNTSLREQVVSDLRAVFPELYTIGIEGEVNEIVIALPQLRYQANCEEKKSLDALKNLFHNSVMKLQKFAKSQSHSWDSTLDLCQLVQKVQIV